MRSLRLGLSIVLLLPALLNAEAASAADAPLEIAVARGGADDCPSAASVSARVAGIRRAARSSAERGAAESRVTVYFERDANEYRARLEFSGAHRGERRLADGGPSCTALAEAVAVAIAVTLDREAPRDGVESEPTQPSTPASATDGAARKKPEAPVGPGSLPSDRVHGSVEAPRARGWALGVWQEAGPAFWFGSGLSWSLASDVEASHSGFALMLGVRVVLPDTVATDQAEFEASFLLGEARTCRIFGDTLSFRACVTVAAGRARGRGRGFSEDRVANLFWAAPGLGAVARLRVGRFLELGGAGTLWAPLRELTFSAENSGTVWRSAPVTAVAALGLGLHFE